MPTCVLAHGCDLNTFAAFLSTKVNRGASAKDVAQLVVTTCFEIDKALTPIIGQRGLEALLNRSLNLASASQAWLLVGADAFDLKANLSELHLTLSLQTSELAAQGGGAFLDHFHQLLTTLVGTPLTERLLRPMWVNFLSGPSPQDPFQ